MGSFCRGCGKLFEFLCILTTWHPILHPLQHNPAATVGPLHSFIGENESCLLSQANAEFFASLEAELKERAFTNKRLVIKIIWLRQS